MTQTQRLYDITRNREVIFIEAIKEIHHLINVNNKTPYNLIRKGAILRLLVIDGSKLYVSINKNFSLKLKMKLKKSYSHGESLASFENPNSSFVISNYFADKEGDEIDIPKFLKLPILKINNPHLKEFLNKNHITEKYNISDLIKLIANAHGGVHFENWGEDIPNYIMTDDSSPFNINSNSKLHETLDNIAFLIIKFLEPLSIAVFENLKKTSPIAWKASLSVTAIKNNKEL